MVRRGDGGWYRLAALIDQRSAAVDQHALLVERSAAKAEGAIDGVEQVGHRAKSGEQGGAAAGESEHVGARAVGDGCRREKREGGVLLNIGASAVQS